MIPSVPSFTRPISPGTPTTRSQLACCLARRPGRSGYRPARGGATADAAGSPPGVGGAVAPGSNTGRQGPSRAPNGTGHPGQRDPACRAGGRLRPDRDGHAGENGDGADGLARALGGERGRESPHESATCPVLTVKTPGRMHPLRERPRLKNPARFGDRHVGPCHLGPADRVEPQGRPVEVAPGRHRRDDQRRDGTQHRAGDRVQARCLLRDKVREGAFVDLVVVGGHGRTGISRFLWGTRLRKSCGTCPARFSWYSHPPRPGGARRLAVQDGGDCSKL